MLPTPLWLALVREMLVVDDGTRITQLSLHGDAAIPDTKPSPRGEGGERSEPDRVLAV